jgi:hypothetical protein
MKIILSRLLAVFFLLVIHSSSYAQDEPATIKFKKESRLSKAIFDNTVPQLLVIDRYGNPTEAQLVSYRLYVKTKSETREFLGYTNKLTGDMINYLNRQRSATKIFFTELSAKDESGHLVKLPDVIDVWFPQCENCDKKKRR